MKKIVTLFWGGVLLMTLSTTSLGQTLYSLSYLWNFQGVLLHEASFDMNTLLQTKESYIIVQNSSWKMAYSKYRDTENWSVMLTQSDNISNTFFRKGWIEGAWGSYMIKGFTTGPSVGYSSSSWQGLIYVGVYIITSPFSKENGRVAINPQYGNATLDKVHYSVMPSIGASLSIPFTLNEF